MKKVTISIILFLLTGVSVLSQTKQITKDQFNELIRNSSELTKKISYRQTRKMESMSNGEVFMIETFVDEFSYPNKNRYIYTIEIEKQITRYESLKIGDTYYCKKIRDGWEISKSSCADDRTFNLELKNIVSETITLENTQLNKNPAKLLKQVIKYRGSDTSFGITLIKQRKIWIDNEGLILKEEAKNENDNSDLPLSSNETTTYEYNPSLAIEIPKVKDQTQGKTVENGLLQEYIENAEKQRETMSHRKKTTIEDYDSNGHKFLRKILITEDFLPPDRYSSIETFDEAGKITKMEFIRVGDKTVERVDSGKWGKPSPKFGSPFGEKIEEIEKTTKLLGIEKIGDKDANVYEVFYKYKSSFKGNVEETARYWFDENGLLLKRKSKEVNLRNSAVRTITNEYDYDVKIKIELPK